MSTRVIRIGKDADAAAAAAQGAAALERGLLVAFPTETVYGLAAVATNEKAMERLRELKNRPARPFSVHLGRPEDARRYAKNLSPAARRLMAKAWPGPLSLVVPVGGRLAAPRLDKAGLYPVLCWEDAIGLRCPDEPTALAMLAAVEDPVVAPSANLAGESSPRSGEDVLDALDGRIDLLIDGGPTRYGKDSTIVRVGGGENGWEVLRSGVFDARTIHRLMKRTYLFVCTGNTCRSPIASGLAKKVLAEKLHVPVAELKKRDVEVLSAGLYAGEGGRATEEAVDAARSLGVDISRHRSQKLTDELVRDSDMIFCMTDVHVAEVRRLVPSAGGKVRRLDDEGDIPDPIGGGGNAYRRTAARIEKALRASLEKVDL